MESVARNVLTLASTLMATLWNALFVRTDRLLRGGSTAGSANSITFFALMAFAAVWLARAIMILLAYIWNWSIPDANLRVAFDASLATPGSAGFVLVFIPVVALGLFAAAGVARAATREAEFRNGIRDALLYGTGLQYAGVLFALLGSVLWVAGVLMIAALAESTWIDALPPIVVWTPMLLLVVASIWAVAVGPMLIYWRMAGAIHPIRRIAAALLASIYYAMTLTAPFIFSAGAYKGYHAYSKARSAITEVASPPVCRISEVWMDSLGITFEMVATAPMGGPPIQIGPQLASAELYPLEPDGRPSDESRRSEIDILASSSPGGRYLLVAPGAVGWARIRLRDLPADSLPWELRPYRYRKFEVAFYWLTDLNVTSNWRDISHPICTARLYRARLRPGPAPIGPTP